MIFIVANVRWRPILGPYKRGKNFAFVEGFPDCYLHDDVSEKNNYQQNMQRIYEGRFTRLIDKRSTYFLSTTATSKPLCQLRRHVNKKNVAPWHVEGVGTSIISWSKFQHCRRVSTVSSGPSINVTLIPKYRQWCVSTCLNWSSSRSSGSFVLLCFGLWRQKQRWTSGSTMWVYTDTLWPLHTFLVKRSICF